MCPTLLREDDTNWPKKNIVGKQELEIRIGNDHIAFEVRTGILQASCLAYLTITFIHLRPQKLGL
jgi:Mago nashi protein